MAIDTNKLIQQLDDCLPQTQCGDCGFSGCLPYAQAIAVGQSEINRCPPGGPETIKSLAAVLHKEVIPLDSALQADKPFMLAKINEDLCIGCVKCIQVCPVDAIIGSAKQLHTVLPNECTGCALCLPPCPVDCITLEKPPLGHRSTQWHNLNIKREDSFRFRARFQKRNARLEKREQAKQKKRRSNDHHIEKKEKLAYIKAAVERTRARNKNPV